MKNALTIDLEEYFQVGAFCQYVRRDHWGDYSSRLQAITDKILELLDSHRSSATFFALGWIGERYPGLVRQIADAGHEIACHSYEHRCVYQMTPAEFREDTRRAKALLENASGKPVHGYRAPSFSVTANSLWALEILAELGFLYDSSIFPVRHPNYGIPHAPRFPFLVRTKSGSLVEFPMSTLEFAGMRSPFAGGAYLRLLSCGFTRWAINFVNQQEQRPVCVYLHPWELDPEQPRMEGSVTARMRHYLGLHGAEAKFRRLLEEIEFCSLGSLLEDDLQPISSEESSLVESR